jgi:N-acetylglucosaminyldiphosphoundecaprenol N-acetyl-beta-D-mannosaminyltransferase
MAGEPMSARYDVLGVRVYAIDPQGLVEEVERWVRDRDRRYVCFTNVHSVMTAISDPQLQRAFNDGFPVTDGMPLVWLGRLRGQPAHRVYGPDLTLALCARAAEVGWRVFFLGGADGVAERLAEELQRRCPGLQVVGAVAPPFRDPTTAEDEGLVTLLNASGAQLVFVGLGCPKQERWMAAHRERLVAPALLGVGAAFDFHTGRVSQAPRWMMRAGLEWFFRLLQEPRRLWRRYLILNPLFVAHAVMQLLGVRRYGTTGRNLSDDARGTG